MAFDDFDHGARNPKSFGEELDRCLVGSSVDCPLGDSDLQVPTKVRVFFPPSKLISASVGDEFDS